MLRSLLPGARIYWWILCKQSLPKFLLNDNYCDFFSGLLTKKFINLLKHAPDGVLDLNSAAETLEVRT